MNGGLLLPVRLNVDIGTVVDEEFYHLCIVDGSCNVQGSPAKLILLIDTSTLDVNELKN